MTWQGVGARGGETGVAQRGAGGTRRARVSSEERHKRSTQKRKRRTKHQSRTNRGDRAAGEEGEAGGQQRHKGTHRLTQRNAKPMTGIEPYRPPRAAIRELMEGRPAGADDGGVPPKGYLGGPPKSAYRSEDKAEALRRVRVREIQPWRADDQREHTEQKNYSKGADKEQKRGEGTEGREERDAREGRPPAMAGDRQGLRPKRAMGQEKSTEGNRDQITCAVLMCVHAGRREPQGRMHSGKEGGRPKKKKTHSTTGGRRAQSEQAAGEREGANGQTRDCGWQAERKNSNSR